MFRCSGWLREIIFAAPVGAGIKEAVHLVGLMEVRHADWFKHEPCGLSRHVGGLVK